MVDRGSIGMIDESVPADSAIKALVVFPKPETALIPRPLRHFRSLALLRLDDETVWMLSMLGMAWTSERLRVAANTLVSLSSQAPVPERVERYLRHALGLNSVMLKTPVLDMVEPRQWGIWETSQALLVRSGPLSISTLTREESIQDRARSIETSLTKDIGEALSTFVDGMNPRATAMASAEGGIDVNQYNYLVYRRFHRYRQQFAESFPSLLSTTLTAAPGSIGSELRTFVDHGVPIVKSLAARWNVRPGVVRHLVGRTADQIGEEWTTNVKALAILLNALRPEDLPGDNSEEWSHFTYITTIGQSLFCKPIWKSKAGRWWLRDCVYHTKRGSHKTWSRWLPDRDTITSIGRLREVLMGCLIRDAGLASADITGSVSDSLEDIADWFFFRSARKGLGNLASRFEKELDQLREELNQASEVTAGNAMWPLIPFDFVSSDCTRVIRPLTTHPSLFSHGFALHNCLGKGYAFRYLRKGSKGTSFIVGVYENGTEIPCSTAEIAVKHYVGTLTYDLVVVQHTAELNRIPSASCAQAIEELMVYCRKPMVRRYLEHAWQLIHNRARPRRWSSTLEIDSTMTTALKRTIGDEGYNNLLAKCLHN